MVALPFPALSPAPPVPAPIARLITDLLHEMGQPLTTLQGCRLFPLLAAGDRDALAAEMSGQVERMTELYRALRQLLAAVMPASPTRPSPTDLHQTLRTAAAEWQRQAERQHLTLVLDHPPQTDFTPAISPSTGHAIECVVTAALAHSPAGSQLRVSFAAPRTTISLAVSSSPHPPQLPAPPSPASLDLRVATALLEAEGGRVVYNLQPFRATIHLPGGETLPPR